MKILQKDEQEILTLSAQGANINTQDPQTNLTILHFICGGFLENHLLDYFEAHHIDNTPRPLLSTTASGGNFRAISWLLDKA